MKIAPSNILKIQRAKTKYEIQQKQQRQKRFGNINLNVKIKENYETCSITIEVTKFAQLAESLPSPSGQDSHKYRSLLYKTNQVADHRADSLLKSNLDKSSLKLQQAKTTCYDKDDKCDSIAQRSIQKRMLEVSKSYEHSVQ